MKTVLSIIGTRPEAIKMAPVLQCLETYSSHFNSIVCVTGQHREMLDQVLDLFNIKPDYDLDVMKTNQSLAGLTSELSYKIDDVITKCSPDYILAQGDTTTVMVTALIAFYNKIPFGHIEAGLRTQSVLLPFPEEANRRISDMLATHYFAPTLKSKNLLLSEKINKKNVYMTGNTVIDSLYYVLQKPYNWSTGVLKDIPYSKKIILITAHRRESFGTGIKQICNAIRIIAKNIVNENYHIVFPVHPNPSIHTVVTAILSKQSNISLVKPLDYLSMVNLLKKSFIVLTDSGGIQEEAPGLGIPVLVMRNETERPEGVDAGVVKLIGNDCDNIVKETIKLIKDKNAYHEMSKKNSPYGDGKSSERIVSILKNVL